jgi:hypothetical protein
MKIRRMGTTGGIIRCPNYPLVLADSHRSARRPVRDVGTAAVNTVTRTFSATEMQVDFDSGQGVVARQTFKRI